MSRSEINAKWREKMDTLINMATTGPPPGETVEQSCSRVHKIGNLLHEIYRLAMTRPSDLHGPVTAEYKIPSLWPDLGVGVAETPRKKVSDDFDCV